MDKLLSAKEVLIQESITLPLEIKDKKALAVQVSFLFEDGSMHHVKPHEDIVSKDLATDCYKNSPIRYETWGFLSEDDTEV